MKFDCAYSVNFNGNKLNGPPTKTFDKACDNLQSSHHGDVEIFIRKNDFFLALFRNNNVKFLEITSLEGVTVTSDKNSDVFEFVIPAKLATAGECKNIIHGYKHDMQISVQITLPSNVDKDGFERMLQKAKKLQSHLETKLIKRDSTHSTFCSNYFCKCQFCLSKRQKERNQFRTSSENVKEVVIPLEKVFTESEVEKIVASEVKDLEEKLEKYEKQILEALQLQEEAVQKLTKEKEIVDEVLQQEIQIFEDKLEEQKRMYEKELLVAKESIEDDERVVQYYKDQLQKERQLQQDLRQEKQQNERILLNENKSCKVIIHQLQKDLISLQKEFEQRATKSEVHGYKVYVTETGKKYHKYEDCSGLSNAKAIWATDINDVGSKEPCKFCRL